jgi:hypothetical protein
MSKIVQSDEEPLRQLAREKRDWQIAITVIIYIFGAVVIGLFLTFLFAREVLGIC